MYNNDIVKPLGQCKLPLKNLRNNKIYDEFVVVDGCPPILGNFAIEEMNLVRVQHHNIMSLRDE